MVSVLVEERCSLSSYAIFVMFQGSVSLFHCVPNLRYITVSTILCPVKYLWDCASVSSLEHKQIII